MSETLSIKISSLEKMRLQTLAEARAVSMSQLIREGLEKVLEGSVCDKGEAKKQQIMQILENHWAESPGGPGDLSTNKKYMEDYGK